MLPLYKIYVSVLAKRLREEIKNKDLISGNQTGYRKRMGIIDQICVKLFNK